jgi:hypothetical protein
LIDRALSLGVDARKIGRVQKSPRPQVLIKTEDENFLCYNKD